jgi:hypothetical protein
MWIGCLPAIVLHSRLVRINMAQMFSRCVLTLMASEISSNVLRSVNGELGFEAWTTFGRDEAD